MAAAQPSAADVIAAGMKYGPNAGLAIQRSQYLADALARLQSDSASIRTPTALWSTLLADGITQWGKNKADKEAMTAYGADRAAQDAAILKGLQPPAANDAAVPAVPTSQAAAGASPDAPAVSPAALGSVPAQIGGPPPSPPSPTSNAPSPTDRLKLAQMVWGEARGEPPTAQQAVAAVALNRLKKQPGMALADILSAPNQFEGYNAKAKAQTPDRLAAILANIAPTIDGADPTGGAVNFLNPTLQAQLGRQQPSWAQGQHQTFGHQDFYGGNPQLAQATPPPARPQLGADGLPPPPPPPDPNGPAVQTVAPYQVAANGATPPPPTAALNAPPPPAPVTPQAGAPPAALPASPGASAAGGAAPVPHPAPSAIPTGLGPTPQEMQLIRSLLADPRTHDQGVALGMKIRERMASPISDPSKPYMGADGRAHFVPGMEFTDQQSSPNQFVQRGPDNQIHTSANAAFGPVAGGMAMNQSGAVAPVPIEQKPRFRIAGAPGQYVTDANGNPTKVADDNYTVKDIGQTMQDLTSSQQYDKAAKLTEMYRGAVQAVTRPGGISDAELKDNAAQIFSGGVARQFNAKMLDEGQGPWLRLKQIAPDLVSGQKLSPESRQAMVQAMHDYATEAQTAFGGLAQSKSAYAAQNGVDLAPFIKPLMQPLPDVPQIGTIPTGIGGYRTGPAAPTGAAVVKLPNGAQISRAQLEAHARAKGWIK